MQLSKERLSELIGYTLSKPQKVMDYAFSVARHLAILSGKRVGKTGYVHYKLLEQSFNRHHVYWVVGRTYEIVGRVWDELEDSAKKMGFICEKKQGKPYRIINPMTETIIQAQSTNQGYTHLRGKSLNGVVIDEACLLQANAFDSDIEPNLTTTGGWSILTSNAPPSSSNWFMQKYYTYKKEQKKWIAAGSNGRSEYAALHFSSYDAPFVPREELDKIKRRLISEGKTDIWNREYMATPPMLKGEVFEYGLEDCCVDNTFFPDVKIPYGRFIASLDPARKKDKPVLCIWDKKIKTAVRFYEYDKMPAPDLEAAVFKDLKKWGVYKLVTDETGGGFYLVDHLKKTARDNSMNIVMTGMSLAGGKKNTIIEALKSRIEQWAIRFVRDPELLRQLECMIAKELDSGYIRYTAPKGDYDDYVDAIAIANYEDMQYPYSEEQINFNINKPVRNNISIIHS